MQDLLQFALTAFVMLIVVVNPVAVAPVFVAVTRGMGAAERRSVLNRAVVIAFGVAFFFLLTGRSMLSYLGVSMHAFAVSGGILLFLIAIPMLFGQRSSLMSAEPGEHRSADEDIAIFPMAIPMLAGPGTLATVLVLATQAGDDFVRSVVLGVTLFVVYLVSWPILHTSDRMIAWMGESKVSIITRVLGIVLAALAVQYVFNGIAGFYDSLAGERI
jgi:multiple antibiotic resistance protein